MEEQGKVIEIRGGAAVVEIEPHEECHKCGSCNASRPRLVMISPEKAGGLNVGDRVEVRIDSLSMMRVYILLYAFPLAAFVGVILALHAVSRSPVISFFGAMAATITTYMFVGRYLKKDRSFSPDVRKMGSTIVNR
ncbi:MAG: hypothetical protein DRP85_05000 [Candidatus Makaraimicrobium thalassicum]|nr:MAG: hypothetical protein DRP85_05000 [Candidatus Omnitrophota bacterium]